jgi:hypothetical protein
LGCPPTLAILAGCGHGFRLRGRHRVNGYVCGMLQPSRNR